MAVADMISLVYFLLYTVGDQSYYSLLTWLLQFLQLVKKDEGGGNSVSNCEAKCVFRTAVIVPSDVTYSLACYSLVSKVKASFPTKMPGQISNFFSRKSVLITGSTGFMGKLMVHKLLTSCPGIENIYLPTRPKKNLRPEERLKSDLLFQDIVNDKPLFDKVKVIESDLLHPDLGLSESAREEIRSNVSFVFHYGASVKFFDPIKQ